MSEDSKSKRSYLETRIREELEHPSTPAPFTRQIVSIHEELERYPELKRIVQEDREKNEYTESTILHLLPDYEEILGLGHEEQVRRDMGVPKPHEREPWPLEDEVRKRMGLPKRKGTEY